MQKSDGDHCSFFEVVLPDGSENILVRHKDCTRYRDDVITDPATGKILTNYEMRMIRVKK